MALLLGASWLVEPDWVAGFLRQMARYPSYTAIGSPIWILTHITFPALGTLGEWGLSLAAVSCLLVAWYSSLREGTQGALAWAVGLCLIVTNLVALRTAMTNYIVLLLPLVAVFRALQRGREGAWLVLLVQLALLVGLWALFLTTVVDKFEHPAVYLPLPYGLLALPFLSSQRDPRRALALCVTASALAMPYYNFYSLNVLFAVGAPPWLVPLTYLPFLPWPAGWEAWHIQALATVPALLVRHRSRWQLPERFQGWWKPLLILLAAFLVRMVHLQARPLWYDEAFAILYAALPPARMVYGTVTPVAGAGAADVHPLLYYFLLHGWMGLVGRSPLAVRFLSVLLGMLTVALLWRLAAWCFSRRVGLAVGLLAAVNPFHVAYSQEARMYALLGLAAVTATYGLMRALQEEAGGRRQGAGGKKQRGNRLFIVHWSLFIVGAALTLYAHNLGLFVLLALNLLAVARRQWWRHLPALALADLAALALFGPWLVGVLPGQVGFVERGYWLTPPGADEAARALMLPVLTFYEPPPGWVLGVGLFASLFLVSLLALRTWRTRSRAGWFLLLCWSPALLLFLLSQWRPVYLERALLPSALFYLVAVGWLLVRGGLPRLLRLGLVALLLVTTAGSLGVHYTYARFPRSPFDQAAAYLREHVQEGDGVVHSNKLTFFPTYYYAPDLPSSFVADPPGSGSDTLARPTQEALGLFPASDVAAAVTGRERVWFVIFDRAIEEYGGRHPHLEWLESHYSLQAVERFNDLQVRLYFREGPDG
nr:hypothetical protein [Anaerolineae bacterium]